MRKRSMLLRCLRCRYQMGRSNPLLEGALGAAMAEHHISQGLILAVASALLLYSVDLNTPVGRASRVAEGME